MRWFALLLACWSRSLVGCAMPEPPGELVGQYAVVGSLLENTCGDGALPVAGVLQYGAELRRDGYTAYWLVGRPPAHLGTYSPSGAVRFRREERFNLQADAEPIDPVLAELDPIALYGFDPFDDRTRDPSAPCTLIVVELVDAMVRGDELSGPTSDGVDLEGTNVIEMRAAFGSECSRVLQTSGGPFESLPCAARYELQGALQ